ncbi:nitroreductase family protein [Patescibacteria group bacterium]
MLDVIKKRRSYRDFSKKQVEKEKIGELLKAAMFSPSANHQRLWEFIVVKSKKTRDLLAATKKWSYFVNLAPVVIVIISKLDVNNKYWIEDGCIAAENIYLEAENQGLGTCFVQIYGSLKDDGTDAQKYVKKVLNIPKSLGVLCLMPIGYPKEKLAQHNDKEFEINKIHKEKYGK